MGRLRTHEAGPRRGGVPPLEGHAPSWPWWSRRAQDERSCHLPSLLATHGKPGRTKIQFAGIDGAYDLDPHYGDDTDLFPPYETILKDALDPALPLVLVTHYPPAGTKCCGSQYDDSGAILVPVAENMYAVGSPLVRKIIETFNPVLVLTGHFHNRFGHEDLIGSTRILNPGPTGKLIEI